MTEMAPGLGEFDFAGDDHVVPFQVEGLDVRGRAVQLGPMLDAILERHNYPLPVARLVAETVVLTVLLGTSLKFDGKLIVQTKSDGPVDLVVADFATPDRVRAYARFNEEALEEALKDGRTQSHELLGKGVLAFTIDQGAHTQRYQGIVALDGATLEEIAGVYFRQSEQIPTKVRLGVAELLDRDENGKPRHRWRAGGMVAQFLPDAPERMRQPDLSGGDGDDNEDLFDEDDLWAEAKVMVETIDADELTDPMVGTERLLYRLFHERGVRVYEPQAVYDRCSCSREKIRSVLTGLHADDIESTIEDGLIKVTCEFCSTTYRFEASEVRQQ
ncbi:MULTISPECIES: Hsp33 family molecular chaperone [Ensifer]|jgi:molecular chaperone Hsp33|uniref:Hsp33 family molecular chaperone n=1 Tax=Ensifer canadensis TaxID=555315 RepID=A0AAW4FDK3_9HYPH|nr:MULTISPECIES: Hsp33 family molecular chaperone [Ensifer]MDP9628533.1 molecular chaperone Hsp33 [Ensifer adhaerens]KQU98203.1 Hsp33-like chaperonin [Ensifer sp. Root31]KQW62961.1 Hsp33-like chaperonin [Ensifer sp. Root1252]KQW84978.1 Hsp33-like chaperonin [Ensifer sp. Root127]KRC83782.1 Hsp33-like chaperonin [Ensifer sp. Root231]